MRPTELAEHSSPSRFARPIAEPWIREPQLRTERAACRVLTTVALSLIAMTASAPAQDAPFALRGFQLGATLEEIRRVRYPDEHKSPIELVCSGEPKAKKFGAETPIETSKIELQAGLRRCAYGWKHNVFDTYIQSRLVIGGSQGYLLLEFFRNGPNEPHRLSQIRIKIQSASFDDLERALTERYGTPTISEQATLRTGIGIEFTSPLLGWVNGTSSIALQKHAGRIDEGILLYAHKALSLASGDRLKANKKVDDKL